MTLPLEVIASVAHKGGVGKSFTLRLLYQAMARVLEKNGEYRKILVVDCDGQCNTTERWTEIEWETSGRLLGKMPLPHPLLEGDRSDISDIWLKNMAPVPYTTKNPKIDIVPARETAIEDVLRSNLTDADILKIREWLSTPEIAEEYCAVFIDTPPSKGPLTQAAIAASTQCYIPVKYEPHPISGMASMLHFVDNEIVGRGDDYPHLNFLGIVANDVPTTNAAIYSQYKAALQAHPSYSPHLLPVELKHLAAYAETDSTTTLPGDVFDYPSKTHSHVLRSAQEFCENMLRRIPAYESWDLNFRQGSSFEQSK
jgi:chromosome partitioning protein